MAITLGNNKPHSPLLKKYIDNLNHNLENHYYLSNHYIPIMLSIARYHPNIQLFTELTEKKEIADSRDELATTMLEKIVSGGYTIEYFSILNDCLSFKNNYSTSCLDSSELNRIYTDTVLINNLINIKNSNVDWLKKVISTFEVKNKGNYIVSITAELPSNFSFTSYSNEKITKDQILGDVWLTTHSNEGFLTLIINARFESGMMISHPVKELSYKGELNLDFQFSKEG